MSVTRLNHVSISVADLDRSLGFWRDLIGLRLRGRGQAAGEHLDRIVGLSGVELEWAELDLPEDNMLELFRYRSPRGSPTRLRTCDPGATHLCLEVDDLDALVAKLRSAGVTLRSPEPVEIPGGDWARWRDLYVVDPD